MVRGKEHSRVFLLNSTLLYENHSVDQEEVAGLFTVLMGKKLPYAVKTPFRNEGVGGGSVRWLSR